MKKALITGITGFVGPNLTNFLMMLTDWEIHGTVRASNGRENDIRDTVPDNYFNKIKFHYCDITVERMVDTLFNDNDFDYCFHLAAQSHPPTSFDFPEYTFITNTLGTINICRAIKKYQPECKLMNCSTSEVYGAVPESSGAITENFPLKPINPYGVSKASADMYVTERAKSAGLLAFNTRAFSHTGIRRGNKFSISSDAYQIARITNGQQDNVIRVGNLESKRVVMDVWDCVEAYYLLMLHAVPGESYNVGGNSLHPISYFLDLLCEIGDIHPERVVDQGLWRPIDIPVQIPDSTKLRILTGWKPKWNIKETLSDLLDYWIRKTKWT